MLQRQHRDATSGRTDHSPYDPEAGYGTKRGSSWVGYKVHLAESWDTDAPRLITDIETTPATTPDDNMGGASVASYFPVSPRRPKDENLTGLV